MRPRWLGRVLGWALLLWGSTIRWRKLGEHRLQGLVDAGEPVVFALWHGRSLLLIPPMRSRNCTALVSRSRDGELATGLLEALTYGVVRGSTSRGGSVGLRGLVRAARAGRIPSVTVDGPRGPAESVAPGVVGVAGLAEAWIVPLAASCASGIQLSSWDQARIPAPGARALLLYGRPIPPPGKDQRESVRTRLQADLRDLHRRADRLCGVGS